jgi:hypothetical protein
MFRGVRLAVRCVLQDASCTEPPNPRLRIGASFVEQDYCARMDAVAENAGRDKESIGIVTFRD